MSAQEGEKFKLVTFALLGVIPADRSTCWRRNILKNYSKVKSFWELVNLKAIDYKRISLQIDCPYKTFKRKSHITPPSPLEFWIPVPIGVLHGFKDMYHKDNH
jgi:hypothetical protein